MGTESALDRSKPLKSFIMALFAESGNYDIEARPPCFSVSACPGLVVSVSSRPAIAVLLGGFSSRTCHGSELNLDMTMSVFCAMPRGLRQPNLHSL